MPLLYSREGIERLWPNQQKGFHPFLHITFKKCFLKDTLLFKLILNHHLWGKLSVDGFISVSASHNSHGSSLWPYLSKTKTFRIHSCIYLILNLTLPWNYLTKPPHPPLPPHSLSSPLELTVLGKYPAGQKGRIDAPYRSFKPLSQHYLSIPMPWTRTCSYSQTTPPLFFYWRLRSNWSGRCSHLLTQVEWPASSGASFISSFHIEWLPA